MRRNPAYFRIVPIATLCAALFACSPSGESGSPSDAGPLDSSQMERALSDALVIPDTLDRVERVTALLRRVDGANVEGAARAYDGLVEVVAPDEVRVFANAWARVDPRAALDWFTDWRASRFGARAISEVVAYWTRHGGAEQVREYAIASLGVPPTEAPVPRNATIDAAAAELAGAGEYPTLTKLLEALPAGEPRGLTIMQALLALQRKGPSGLRDWIDSIPWEANNDLKRDAFGIGIALLAQRDGEGAARWYASAEEKLPPGAFLDSIVAAWGPVQPRATLEWLLDRGNGRNRNAALRAAAYHYLKADGPAASAWISERLGDPVVRIPMLFPLVQYLMTVDVQKALVLVPQLDDASERLQALRDTLLAWAKTDLPAVEKYMAEVRVPPSVADAINGFKSIRRHRVPNDGAAE